MVKVYLKLRACLINKTGGSTVNHISIVLPSSEITLHSVFAQSQTFRILIKHIGKTINNCETKYMQYENIFYDNSNDGYFIL
jgi:hypothetical protein